MSKTILRKNGNGGISLPDCRLYYKATVIKTVRYWPRDRNSDQWGKIGSPEIKPHTHGHFIFGEEAKIYNTEKTASWISSAGKTGQPHSKNEIFILF